MRTCLVILMFGLTGCELFFEVDSVQYQFVTPMEDMSEDAHDMVDMPPDIAEDLPEVDMPPEEPEICTPGGEKLGNCNPVRQDCEGEFMGCVQVLDLTQMRLNDQCSDARSYVLDEGEPCSANVKCKIGLLCRETCRRICDRDTGEGCLTGEFCAVYDENYGYGICNDSCN